MNEKICKNCGFPFGHHQAGSLNCPVKESRMRTQAEVIYDLKLAQRGIYKDSLHREWRETSFEERKENE